MPDSKASFNELKEWFKFHGGFAHPALNREYRGGVWGIFATEPIGESEIFAEIPRSLIIGPSLYAKAVANSQNFSLVHERDQTLFAFLLEVEKQKGSVFYPWISQLPLLDDFKSFHPLFATENELKQLNQLNSRIVRTLQNFKRRIDEFQEQTCGRFEFTQVLWASLIYLTRAFEENGLVPLFDMFNHNATLGHGLVDDRLLKAGQTIGAAEEVYISYGKNFDSLELWLHFGFLDKNAATIINCSNVHTGRASLKFDQECYFSEAGPSARLVEICEKLKSPEQSLNDLLNTLAGSLSREIGDCAQAQSPLVQQAQELMLARRQLLL